MLKSTQITGKISDINKSLPIRFQFIAFRTLRDDYKVKILEAKIRAMNTPDFIDICKMFGSYKLSDIYSGTEKIPFKERDPEYKRILRQEFASSYNVQFKVFKPIVKFPSF